MSLELVSEKGPVQHVHNSRAFLSLSGDPRRNESLVKFLTSLSLDVESSEAFKEARKGYLLGSTMSGRFFPRERLFLPH